jgi:SAM-dependent methyltransferase
MLQSDVDIKPVRLDIGCGKNKKEGFTGVDALPFDGVDVVHNLTDRWPWDDGAVDEIHASHVIEHFNAGQRCFIFNEMHRVLKVGGTVTLIAPHWASNRAYGDPTHQWPPFAEMALFYLDKAWRETQAPHTNDLLSCDFAATWGYSLNPALNTRNEEYRQYAVNNHKEAVQDLHATLVKKDG